MDIAVLAEFMRDQLMTEDHALHAHQPKHKFCKKMVTARLVLDIPELILQTDFVFKIHAVAENISRTLVPALNAVITPVLTLRTTDASLILATLDRFKLLMEDVKIAQFIRNQMLLRKNVLRLNAHQDNICLKMVAAKTVMIIKEVNQLKLDFQHTFVDQIFATLDKRS